MEDKELNQQGTSFNEFPDEELPKGETLAEVGYDVTIPEEEKAFKLFQRLYVLKANITKTIVLGIVFVIFLFQLVKGMAPYVSAMGITIAVIAIFVTWYNPVVIRKSLMKALKPLENDRYIFKLFSDAFTIETVIDESEFEEGEERISPPPRVVWKQKSDFEVRELDDMFVIIMKKETIYVLPKRCMDENTQETIRKNLISEKSE